MDLSGINVNFDFKQSIILSQNHKGKRKKVKKLNIYSLLKNEMLGLLWYRLRLV